MSNVSVYLDSCIISRIYDARLKANMAQALAKIVKHPEIQLVTSHKTGTELSRAADPKRKDMLMFFDSFVPKVPVRVLQLSCTLGGAMLGACYLGGAPIDPLLSQLAQIFDVDDAEHVTQASHANCHYFLTLDDATILKRVPLHATKLKELCGALEIVNPEQLAQRLSTT